MTIDELEQQYSELRSKYNAGVLNDEDFVKGCSRLAYTDADGTCWRIDATTGSWRTLQNEAIQNDLPDLLSNLMGSIPENDQSFSILDASDSWSLYSPTDTHDQELPPDSGIADDFLENAVKRFIDHGQHQVPQSAADSCPLCHRPLPLGVESCPYCNQD